MNLKNYINDAIRTESKIEKLDINLPQLVRLFKMYVTLGEVLDGVKKGIFYGNDKKYREELDEAMKEIKFIAEMSDSFYNEDNLNMCGDIISNINPRVFHGILGLMTESSELADVIVKLLESPNGKIDVVNVHEEMHDMSWYMAILHHCLELDWEQGMKNNIEKLRVRFPEKFTQENADVRDLDAEREMLEKR